MKPLNKASTLKPMSQASFTQASLLFIVDGAVYALASPLVGLLLDRLTIVEFSAH